jgi:hypothetical protein
MKTLVAALLALGAGTVLGVAAVIGVKASLDPDKTITQSDQSPINVLEYGDRG